MRQCSAWALGTRGVRPSPVRSLAPHPGIPVALEILATLATPVAGAPKDRGPMVLKTPMGGMVPNPRVERDPSPITHTSPKSGKEVRREKRYPYLSKCGNR